MHIPTVIVMTVMIKSKLSRLNNVYLFRVSVGCTSLVRGSARTLNRKTSVAVARYTENGQRVAKTANTQIVPMLHLAHLVGISAHCNGCATLVSTLSH